MVPHNRIIILLYHLYDLLTYASLAHWIMCDGTYNSGIRLQTDSFSIQDVVFIINVLKVKFNLDCTVHYQRGNPVIYISSRSTKLLIAPYG